MNKTNQKRIKSWSKRTICSVSPRFICSYSKFVCRVRLRFVRNVCSRGLWVRPTESSNMTFSYQLRSVSFHFLSLFWTVLFCLPLSTLRLHFFSSFNVTDTIVVVGCVDTFCFFSPSFFYWLVCLCARISPGLCALSISNDNCYLAYPGSATIGEVQVFDTVNLVGEPRQWYFMCSCF